jgi:phenylalanine-4-hydroxylase
MGQATHPMKSNLKIPVHLKQFLVKQDYSLYTAIDQAAWRYIMRVSEAFFKDHAHPIYVDGLKRAGISTEKIPRISEMDEKLKKFGWRAVSVTGFIPPEIFMEMLSLQILPIACDMRNLGHIEYTPAPDIVHEAAGHAPILADPSYSSFLKRFGEIARRVIFAKEDTEVYEAVRELSEIKEDPGATEEDITDAQKKLDSAYAKVSYVSEARALTRLGWWTTEYGLFKKDDKFLIYGAGLLSSAGESYNCLSEKVKKIPLDIRCTEMDYDITKPQLQLFYTDDFSWWSRKS